MTGAAMPDAGDEASTFGDIKAATNYAGAVYGSLLAASVVVGTAPLKGAPTLGELVGLLITTGIVFWLAHVYARLVGERVSTGERVTWPEIRRVGRHEWPLVEAAILPCIVAAVIHVLGGTDVTAAWAALIAAVAGQVGWAVAATVRSGASTLVVIVSGVTNLVLGAVLVLLKGMLTH